MMNWETYKQLNHEQREYWKYHLASRPRFGKGLLWPLIFFFLVFTSQAGVILLVIKDPSFAAFKGRMALYMANLWAVGLSSLVVYGFYVVSSAGALVLHSYRESKFLKNCGVKRVWFGKMSPPRFFVYRVKGGRAL